MDQPEVELGQIATWLSEQGLSPGSPEKAQLCLLWRAHQHTRSRLSSVTRDLDIQRSQHVAEMAEVRKSLEQIRIFTKHKDALAQQIQDENDHLKDQLQRLISRQDAQISEVAKMLYQQGLTELIHSSPSEQVAYLLVERASLLEMSRDPDNPTSDANTMSTLGTETQVSNHHAQQSPHKGAPRHGLSPWKRLLGLHRPSQSKHVFIPAGPRHLTSEASSVERQCSRLEWDLEEGSRRLAMAHNEIRRLTDELESAHLTRRAYEPELQAAQQEVKQLRQEVEKLNNYEMVELRKAKDLNNRLDLEIRALRSRVRSLDAGKSSLQQMVLSLQEEKERLEAALQHQTEQQLLAEQVQPDQAMELAKVASLQKEVERLQSALQEQQQQLLTVQVQANQANELAKFQETELNQRYDICRDLQNKLSAQTKCLLEKESEIHSLKQDNTLKDLGNLTANIYTKENIEDQSTPWQVEDSFTTEDKELHTQLYKKITLNKECPDYQETVRTLLTTQEECESLKEEICETLKCIDKERSKYHETKEKHKAKLCRAKQKFDDETTQRDEKIKSLERELSLCSHSLAKEKELVISITRENDKLLVERRRLLQQLSEEEHNKEESHLTASLSKCRVDFLEMENKKLVNKTLHMSNQLAVLDRTLQNMQSLHFAEELKKIYHPQRPSASPSVQTSSVTVTEPSKIQTLLDDTESDHTKQTVMTLSPRCLISVALSRSAEMGYLNLTSTQNCSDTSGALNSSESV